MSNTLTPHPESLTLREAIEAKVGAASVAETLVGLLSSTNSRAVMEGLKLTAWLAHIVIEEEQGFVAAVSPDDLRRMGAAFAAVIRDESARFDWKSHPSPGGFLQQMYERHPEAQDALVAGAMLNAKHLRTRLPKRITPPPPPNPSPEPLVESRPAIVPDTPPNSATASLPLTLPCIKCKQAPRRPQQRTCKQCHAEAMRESRRRKLARLTALAQAPPPTPWPPVYPQESLCEWCHEPFKPQYHGQRFCGNVCGGKHATTVLKAEQQRRAEGW